MSRRIAIFAFVASSALIAAPVIADQECFDSACLAPDISAAPEPVPPESVQTPVEVVQPSDEVARAPAEIVRKLDEMTRAKSMPDSETFRAPNEVAKDIATKDIAATPPRPLDDTMAKQVAKEKELAKEIAKMPVVETPLPAVVARKAPPAPRIYPKSEPQPPVRHAAQPALQPVTDANDQPPAQEQLRVVGSRSRPRTEPMTVPVEAAARAPVQPVQEAYNAAPASAYVSASSYRRAAPNVVVVAPPVAEDGTIVGYPGARPDPTWKVCQIDPRSGRSVYCTPYSYHPYGAGGYRPMGSYRAYGTTPGYVMTQPDAKIIAVEQAD